ncbi:hypothetical protein CEXT_441541 [Caerostris extrusa]|uniref:Uncharacterized protein n=1 Tax=Caerostris extrusa TaxID=172846 RepID=A0AAV4XL74_CAEEX|nr:hypothetical protein CEXT_441541 [Caerostris extrusa]
MINQSKSQLTSGYLSSLKVKQRRALCFGAKQTICVLRFYEEQPQGSKEGSFPILFIEPDKKGILCDIFIYTLPVTDTEDFCPTPLVEKNPLVPSLYLSGRYGAERKLKTYCDCFTYEISIYDFIVDDSFTTYNLKCVQKAAKSIFPHQNRKENSRIRSRDPTTNNEEHDKGPSEESRNF